MLETLKTEVSCPKTVAGYLYEGVNTNKITVIHPTAEEREQERLKQQAEAEARRKAQEAALKKLQDERKKQEEQEAEDAKKKKEEEEAKKKNEEEAKKKQDEEAAKKKEEEAKKQEEEAAKKVAADGASQPNEPDQNNPNEPATLPVIKPEDTESEVSDTEKAEQSSPKKDPAADRLLKGLANDVPLEDLLDEIENDS